MNKLVQVSISTKALLYINLTCITCVVLEKKIVKEFIPVLAPCLCKTLNPDSDLVLTPALTPS